LTVFGNAAFETRDFYLVYVLCCTGYELLDLRFEGRRILFVFRERPTRRDDVLAFTARTPLVFSATIKSTEARLHNV
jgi:hypothetical protein